MRPFSEDWCGAVNRALLDQTEALDRVGGTQGASGSASGSSPVAVDIAIRVRHPNQEEDLGILVLTPYEAPYVTVRPGATSQEEGAPVAEVELPERSIARMSGRPMSAFVHDPSIVSTIRVRRGMDAITELLYRHDQGSPIRELTFPELA